MTLVWRPLTEADIPEWVRLNEVVAEADHTGDHLDADELTETATSVSVDLPTGSVGVFDGDKLVAAGLAHVRPSQVGVHHVTLDGAVHPEHRRTGLGTRLHAELDRLGRARHERTQPELPLELRAICHDRNAGKHALLDGLGYRPARWFFDMRRDLTDPPPRVPPWPAQLRLSGYYSSSTS